MYRATDSEPAPPGTASSNDVADIRTAALGQRVPSPDGELTILADVTLAIARRETVAVVGASGSGKSTLLGLMAGLDLPSDGSVYLRGQSLSALEEDGRARLRARRVGR